MLNDGPTPEQAWKIILALICSAAGVAAMAGAAMALNLYGAALFFSLIDLLIIVAMLAFSIEECLHEILNKP